MGSAAMTHKVTAEKVRAERDEKLLEQMLKIVNMVKLHKINQQRMQEISNKTAQELVFLLNQKKVTSKELVLIFCSRAATIGQQLNLITEQNFQQAIAGAQACDKIRKESGKKNWTFNDFEKNLKSDINGIQDNYLPPLFGVPFSVKDCFHIEGMRTTIGLTARSEKVHDEDGSIIKCLKNAGMIPFVKTNTPQGMLTFETTNLLWGKSLNIWDSNRTVGGSSGGEAGLIAAKCSPLGLGSDAGGSLRIPAEFCGIFSLKPSQNRLSTRHQCHMSESITGKDTFKIVVGPMAREVEDLALWMKTATTEHYYQDQKDIYCKLHSFDTKKYIQSQQSSQKFKIGYFKSLKFFQSSRASQRAVEEAVVFLQKKGHEMVQMEIPNEIEMLREFFAEVTCEGKSRSLFEMTQGEELIPEYIKGVQVSKLHPWIIKLLHPIVKKLYPRIGVILDKTIELSTDEYLKHVGRSARLREEFYAFWKRKGLDFVISPGFACQALLHGFTSDLTLTAVYGLLWNFVGYAVGNMPITVVNSDQQQYDSKYQDRMTNKLKENAQQSKGLPVGIQLIGLPFEEERLLGLMRTIEKHFQFNARHPAPYL